MELPDKETMSVRSRFYRIVAAISILLVLDRLQEILYLFPVYKGLYESYPFYIPEGGKSILQILLAVFGMQLLTRSQPRDAVSELGFKAPIWKGLSFGLGATFLMILGFALTNPFRLPDDGFAAVYLVGISPLAEETLYRAFAVGALYFRCRLPLWLSLLIPASIFGFGHVSSGSGLVENIGLFLLLSSGGLFFGWFYIRWSRNLWAPFFLHAAMNLCWQIFDVSDSAIGGWWPFLLQISAIIVAVLLTLKFTSRKGQKDEHLEQADSGNADMPQA